ncbi:hypothetical protein [Ensifer canadensis]
MAENVAARPSARLSRWFVFYAAAVGPLILLLLVMVFGPMLSTSGSRPRDLWRDAGGLMDGIATAYLYGLLPAVLVGSLIKLLSGHLRQRWMILPITLLSAFLVSAGLAAIPLLWSELLRKGLWSGDFLLRAQVAAHFIFGFGMLLAAPAVTGTALWLFVSQFRRSTN